LDPAWYLGGRRPLDRDLAQRAIHDRLARPMGCDVTAAALETVRSIESQIASALRGAIAAVGPRPGRWTLFAFGGAGGLFAANIARAVGTDVYVFRHGSVLNAFGSSGMDIVHLYEVATNAPADLGAADTIAALMEDLALQAQRDMRGEGFGDDRTLAFAVEVETVTREGEVATRRMARTGTWASTLRTVLAGWAEGSRVVAARLFVSAPVQHAPLAETAAGSGDPVAAAKGSRRATFTTGAREVSVYERAGLRSGDLVRGPALVEGADTTILVPENAALSVDRYLNAALRWDAP